MPTVIRQILSDRIRRLPALQGILRDFTTATGMAVEFVSPLGHREVERNAGPLCSLLRQAPGGCRLCGATVQQLLERATLEPVHVRCDAGLWESAVPLVGGGQIFGYLVMGGYFTAAPDLPERNRIRHLVARLGATLDEQAIEQLCAQSTLIGGERQAALLRLLELAAKHLVVTISGTLVAPSGQLSTLVQSVCVQAQRTFMHEVSLRVIAKKSGVTTEHLCRVFHQSTGLRFREYVGRLRADYARELLLGTDRSVTEIAFTSGFQSISQFNRIFRVVYGTTPQQLRRAKSSPAP